MITVLNVYCARDRLWLLSTPALDSRPFTVPLPTGRPLYPEQVLFFTHKNSVRACFLKFGSVRALHNIHRDTVICKKFYHRYDRYCRTQAVP